jgi:hypothetical protein
LQQAGNGFLIVGQRTTSVLPSPFKAAAPVSVSAHGVVFAFDTSAADDPLAATNRKNDKNN